MLWLWNGGALAITIPRRSGLPSEASVSAQRMRKEKEEEEEEKKRRG
jgi:hypothetical protein